MTVAWSAPPGFWRTVWLLARSARKRANGRRKRQQQLLNNRKAIDWGWLGVLVSVLFTAFVHGAAAFAVMAAADAAAERSQALAHPGKIVVSRAFYGGMAEVVAAYDRGTLTGGEADALHRRESDLFHDEASRLANRRGSAVDVEEKRLRAAVDAGDMRGLVPVDVDGFGNARALGSVARPGHTAGLVVSLLLVWWFAMVVCQGEGLELDLQRRRHPMWEWLFSHPVRPAAVFLAEMVGPLAANPIYWTAPLFVGVLYGAAAGPGAGMVAALAIGVPLTLAAACLGKAFEIAALLRLAARSRGAVIGVMGWFGYASMLLMFFALSLAPKAVALAGPWLDTLAGWPWPLARWIMGMGADGVPSLGWGIAFGWLAAIVIIAAATGISARAVRGGLIGPTSAERRPSQRTIRADFRRDPLVRKEYLWFVRDRSAIVQVFLIPLTVAAFQLFNLRGLLEHVGDSWNILCAAAVLFGTYFLWVLGPKSLTSEGPALWLALTWPRGLEELLKAKARLWASIASALVAMVLLFGCWLFPQQIWKIGLVAAGWAVFARSMAQKAVTLVTVTAESGEPEKIPAGRRWAAQLGMLTFAIGVSTQQWHMALIGIVYSWITAAAMWQNLRARLPFLYDPWSEALPAPPTLMHAMVAISLLIECSALVSLMLYGLTGGAPTGITQALGYGVCAAAVSTGTMIFLANRGVEPWQVWRWAGVAETGEAPPTWLQRYVLDQWADLRWLACGLFAGIGLGLFAQVYLAIVHHIPAAAEAIEAARRQTHEMPGLATSYAVIAIAFAPLAEEYLFRGLLYRTLDREWGGWAAVCGAAAFFAIYHPPLAWLPVGLLGVASCLLFKRSGRLAPAVLLHLAYNTVAVLAQG